MELINSIFQYFILPATVAGVLGYFGKQIIESYFAKRFEVYKSELNKVSYEYQIRFSKLYEKRVGIIEELYIHIIDLNQLLKSYNDKKSGGKYEEKELVELFNKWKTLNEFFTKNDIYFSKNISDKIRHVVTFVYELIISFNIAHAHIKMINEYVKTKPELEKELKDDEFYEIEANHEKDDKYFVNDYLPSLESQLKDEFRKLIGADV